MFDLMYWQTDSLLFDIPLLYYGTNLNSLIICCHFPEGIHLFFSIYSLLLSAFKLSCEDSFETLVVLSAIVLPTKSPVASAVS